MIYLETSRLILRNYQTTDFADIMVYFSDEEVCKYEDFYPMSDEQVRKIISEWKEMDNRLVVELKSKSIVIGSIGYWVDDEGHHCIDYDFNPQYGGNGYATEAGDALVSYLFKEMGIEAIYGDCDIRNVSSWMLLERLGFQRMQKLDNQSYKNDKDGKPIIISTFLYGLKKVDFDFEANKEKKIEKQKRVVFLDIDGVLNSNFWNESHQREISDGTLIDESKIELLCKLIKETDAQLILHSGWKYWFGSDLKPLRKEAENLRALLEREGLTIAGVTPDHATDEIKESKKFSLIKAGEILEWLAQHEDVDKWVVLDDLDLHNAEIEKHQVRTDRSIGLTDEDVEKAKRMLRMLPTREEAEKLLLEAEECNPGPWGNHSRVAAQCAEKIAALCEGMDADKAYILGLLHDIGRKFGVKHLGHVYDGYKYMLELGYDEVAKICLTHSFNVPDIYVYIGHCDITKEEQQEIEDALNNVVYDDYDRLIQLCDSLAGAEGVMDIEVRMADVKRRYGDYPKEKWDKNLFLMQMFEKKMGKNIYEVVGK